MTQETFNFDGKTFDKAFDGIRLKRQLDQVRELMKERRWWTLRELWARIQGSESAISARIRDLRKPKFGGYTILSRRRSKGLWEYRLEERGFYENNLG